VSIRKSIFFPNRFNVRFNVPFFCFDPRILKTLDHMNIINAYEVFQAKRSRTLMIVMELCTGGDLYARIPYTEQQAGRIIKQLLSAISYMHDRKIIHRDLKFENIVFESKDPDALIKVIDFGLSKE